MIGQSPTSSADPGAGLPAHQRMQLQRQRAFVSSGIAAMQLLGHDQAKHAVAQKFQPLVGAGGIGAGMGQRALEKRFVLKPWPSCFGKRAGHFTRVRIRV